MKRRRKEMASLRVAANRSPTSRQRWHLLPGALIATLLLLILNQVTQIPSTQASSLAAESGVRFDPETNAYSGLTFTFDPRLDKRVEWLNSEHWQLVMQQTSSLLHESLNGRAHLGEVRVLIPYKWRNFQWPLMQKPGSPIMANRRLRYSDSDVIVGFEDPVYKETPFAVQHDECARQGLNIQMPISFLEQNSPLTSDPRLKGRLLAREFASHRYGVFKESGFRSDYAYPPFASLAGLPTGPGAQPSLAMYRKSSGGGGGGGGSWAELNGTAQGGAQEAHQFVRGFDEHWNECSFDTSPANGLPLPHAARCVAYLTRAPNNTQNGHVSSFNLMSSDPFSYTEAWRSGASNSRAIESMGANQALPLQWADFADGSQVRWHFCGENFASQVGGQQTSAPMDQQQPPVLVKPAKRPTGLRESQQQQQQWFEHNQRAMNKQNKMCQERSAMDVIKLHEDFRRAPFSPSTFNRLPAPSFKFLQEMPPRLVLCIEYGAHLYQSRRLDHGILDAAIAKLLAFDLIGDSEVALVLFGQQHSTRGPFKRLDPTLYSPPFDPFDEPAKLYTDQELAQLDIHNQGAKIVKGSCSFAKLMGEVGNSLAQRSQYDDLGADVVVITSGLFIEDELKIEEIVKSMSYKPENMQVNLIIYPSTMLFDTKSRDGFIALDNIESDAVVRSRLSKLLLVQRLLNAQIHLVKEHLDANGDVKMSTLLQFHQIFEHITRGHSWDQTNATLTLSQQTVEAQHHNHQVNGSKLSFQFEVDASIQNELLVGFIDPKHHSLTKLGKRFAIKNLQLRSPTGQLIFTDCHPWILGNQMLGHNHEQDSTASSQSANLRSSSDETGGQQESPEYQIGDGNSRQISSLIQVAGQTNSQAVESALFPYRTQLNLAGFHLKPWHLAHLNATNQLAGTWTLTGTADEPIQTSGIAMARANPQGDTITSTCWVQTYYGGEQSASGAGSESDLNGKSGQLRAVKVFMQTKAGAQLSPIQEVSARMEVQDAMGNIVQNVNMLDDGLGVPDMTRGDGIYSQYVQNAYRPGFYKVSVELMDQTTKQHRYNHHHHQHQNSRNNQQQPAISTMNGSNGQDNACCGSFVPHQARPETRHLSRLMYCGTFHVDNSNRLAQQRPPRVNNLTVVNVDQENRRVTIRWFEPQIDISHRNSLLASSGKQQQQQLDQWTAESEQSAADESQSQADSLASAEPMALVGSASSSRQWKRAAPSRHLLSAREVSSGEAEAISGGEHNQDNHKSQLLTDQDFERISNQQSQQMRANSIRGMIVGKSPATNELINQQPLSSRYDIKLFTDRDMIKRAFDAKQEIGFKFNEWNVEGTFPNASAYGGMKEVTLRIPYGREGIYFIALKVYDDLGIGSQMSNIVQFYIRSNLTLEEVESIYGQATTIDPEGNIYNANGVLLQRASGQLRGTPLDGLSALILFSLIAFISSIFCITLVACLASSARRSLGQRKGKSEDKKAVASSVMTGAGSGSSMVSSGCGSSQQSEIASSVGGGSQGGHDVEINKLALGDELTFNNLQHQHQHQQHQAQMIQNQMISANNHYQQQQQQQQQQQYPISHYDNHNIHDKSSAWPQHTLVNGYAYATVNPAGQFSMQQPDNQMDGDMNQNGLGHPTMSPVQSWPADILLSHYDKVKQARERNEAPPVMRIETLEHQGQFADGLPAPIEDHNHQHRHHHQQQPADVESSYLVRQQRSSTASYLNQQLHQQLTSVLKTKHSQWTRGENSGAGEVQLQPNQLDKSSPALEGVTELNESDLATYGNQSHMAPPPQYVYCGGQEANGLGVPAQQQQQQQQLNVEPSIYSQVTNLQQVPASTSYYANQWSLANQQQQQQQQQNAIYSTAVIAHQQQVAGDSNNNISEV